MSTFKADLIRWHDAVTAFDKQEYNNSLELLEGIADSAKIHFNIGVILATLREHELAIEAYIDALRADQYFAVGYFQKGVSNFLLGNFEDALEDFNDALLYLRSNLMIDYQQLGLDYKLYSCEVFFNRGLCYIYLDKETEGLEDFEAAQREKQTPDHDIIDQVLEQGVDNLSVFAVPPGILYRPPESKIKNAKKVDYLGSSTLIAAVDKNEMFTGFQGAFLRKQAQGADEKISPVPASTLQKPLQRSATTATYANNQFARRAALTNITQDPNGPNTDGVETGTARIGLQRRATDAGATRTNGGSSPDPTWRSSRAPGPLTKAVKATLMRANTYSTKLRTKNEEVTSVTSPRLVETTTVLSTTSSASLHRLSDPNLYSSRTEIVTRSIGNPVPGNPESIVRTESPDVKVSTSLKVKCHYKDTRVLIADPMITFSQLAERIQQKFNSPVPLRLKYKDEDDEFVIMTDQEDMDIARGILRSGPRTPSSISHPSVDKLEIWCIAEPSNTYL